MARLDAEAQALWRRARRRELLAARAALTPEVRRAASERIFAQVDALVRARGARVVGAYLPIRSEPDAAPWIASFCAGGGVLGLPVIAGGAMRFAHWNPGAPLREGPLGTREPAGGATMMPELVVVPVVGFDGREYRLGYGGGFYDRLLAGPRRPFAIGVGFGVARMDGFVALPHDVPMDVVVTEDGFTGVA